MDRWVWIRGALALCLTLAACAAEEAGEPEDGADGGGDMGEGPPRQLIRLDLLRESGAVSVAGIEAISIGDDDAPPSPMVDGEYAIVTYRGDEIAEAALVSFPDHLDIEPGPGAGGGGQPIDLTGRPVSATVYLTDLADIDRLAILDSSNTVVATLDGGEIPHGGGDRGIGSRSLGLSSGLAGTPYEHIRVLEAGDRAYLPILFNLEAWEIYTPSEEQIAILRDGFSRVTPEVRGAVTTVAFVDPNPLLEWISGGWAGIAFGNTFLLNAETDADYLRGTVVHESAHNYTFLMASVSGALGVPSLRWDADVIASAEDRLERFGVRASLRGGMVDAWRSLQASAVSLGLAADYQGSAWDSFPQSAVAANGFASRYGSSNPWEDIAEQVQALQAPEYGGEVHPLCERLRADQEMEAYKALGYAKILFLENLGFISDAALEACAAGFLPTGTDGIHLYYDDGATPVHFTGDPQAGYYDDGGTRMLAMLASGGAYGALLQVNPYDGAGLGLHRLDQIGLWNVAESGLDGFYLSNSENDALARVSDSGLVVVTQVSQDKVEGIILYLNLANAFGDITDTFSWGTFRWSR
jgi:hypothetical protein